jgi:predicted choloylglycine hydrolase
VVTTPTTTVRTVAGGPDDFMVVRHLVASGSSRAIGRALATEAAAAFGATAYPAADPVVARARRRWIARNWPEQYERMRGFAEVFGIEPDDAGLDFAELVAVPLTALTTPGCSAVWCPPTAAADGVPRLARNYDFSTGSVFDVLTATGHGIGDLPGQPAMTSRPYVVELHPDDGYASVAVGAYDLAGAIEGINDQGLAVVLLADDETPNLAPTGVPQVGLHELQVGRFLLDRCATAADARDALLDAKQYDELFACHYVVADAAGDAFVWERDTHNAEHVVDAGEQPLCVTNHLLHRRPSPRDVPDDVPGDELRSDTYRRARVLDARVGDGAVTEDGLRDALAAVRMDGRYDAQLPTPGRTLWFTMYDLAARAMTIEFYLGEGDGHGLRYSPALTFAVAGTS